MFTEGFADHFGPICGFFIEAPAEYLTFCKIISHKPCAFEYVIITALCIVFQDDVLGFSLAMMILGTVFSKQSVKITGVAAAVTVSVFQLSFSFCGAVIGMISCAADEEIMSDFGLAAMLSGELFSLLLSVFVLKLISDIPKNSFASTVFMPIPIIFISGCYVNHVILGSTVSYNNIPPLNNYLYAVIAAVFGLTAVYALFISEDRLRQLEYANAVQKKMIDDIRDKLDKTKALRHDLKNHMTVLKEFVISGKNENAVQYYLDLDKRYALPSDYRTGSAAADIIIADKISSAYDKKIEVECHLKIPAEKINDVDICTLLANALDNAVKGCESAAGKKYIRISSHEKGDIFLINIENSFNGSTSFDNGTGIRNMKKTAEKYGGYVHISCNENIFRTSILLIISHH